MTAAARSPVVLRLGGLRTAHLATDVAVGASWRSCVSCRKARSQQFRGAHFTRARTTAMRFEGSAAAPPAGSSVTGKAHDVTGSRRLGVRVRSARSASPRRDHRCAPARSPTGRGWRRGRWRRAAARRVRAHGESSVLRASAPSAAVGAASGAATPFPQRRRMSGLYAAPRAARGCLLESVTRGRRSRSKPVDPA